MTWRLEFTGKASKKLLKLDSPIRKLIATFFDELIELEDPLIKGKALTGKLSGLWRYRVGDFRIICQINGKTIVILVLDVGHRKEIYKN
jgi:mRNA interferase RelE/StbE